MTERNERNEAEKEEWEKVKWIVQVKSNIAIAMSAILVTTSAITLPLMNSFGDKKKHPHLDDLFYFFGLLSVLTSAFLIDWLLDQLEIPWKDRFTILGGGYCSFSILVSGLSVVISAYFYSCEREPTSFLSYPFFWFICLSLSVFFKMMTLKEDKNIAGCAVVLCFFISYLMVKFYE